MDKRRYKVVLFLAFWFLIFLIQFASCLEIRVPRPYGNQTMVFVGGEKTFSVGNDDYERIEWYLNGKLVFSSDRTYAFKAEQEGNYTLEVKIYSGDQEAYKKWGIEVIDDETGVLAFDVGKVIFYALILILVILVGLIVYYIISALKNRQKSVPLGFGVTKIEEPIANKIIQKERLEHLGSIKQSLENKKISEEIRPTETLASVKPQLEGISQTNKKPFTEEQTSDTQKEMLKKKRFVLPELDDFDMKEDAD